MVSRFTGGVSWGISWCQGLLVEVILRYIMVSRFISGGCLEVYHGVKVYWWRLS
jgi:hypothetical protein